MSALNFILIIFGKGSRNQDSTYFKSENNGLYSLLLGHCLSTHLFMHLIVKPSFFCWHHRLVYLYERYIHIVLCKHYIPLSSSSSSNLCSAWKFCKSHKLLLPYRVNKSSSILKLIFVDVWGSLSFILLWWSQIFTFLLMIFLALRGVI